MKTNMRIEDVQPAMRWRIGVEELALAMWQLMQYPIAPPAEVQNRLAEAVAVTARLRGLTTFHAVGWTGERCPVTASVRARVVAELSFPGLGSWPDAARYTYDNVDHLAYGWQQRLGQLARLAQALFTHAELPAEVEAALLPAVEAVDALERAAKAHRVGGVGWDWLRLTG